MAWTFRGSYRLRLSQPTSQPVKEHLGTDDHRHMALQKLPLLKSYRQRQVGGGVDGKRTNPALKTDGEHQDEMEKHSQVTVILIPTLIFISFMTLNNSLDLRVSVHSLLREGGDLILRVHQTKHIGKSNGIINIVPYLNQRSSA